ncbi:hypothetical protein [Rhizobium acidisoli]|uniref:hypothetical protein n=1 Tax=Rhizobium acidisoli TaxID=1538158 RepID=UPI001FDA6D0F|nr:hypothetical protein [Rhizobium acidisoli]
MSGEHGPGYLTASLPYFAIDCESVRQRRRCGAVVSPAVRVAIHGRVLPSIMLVERNVLMRIVDKGGLLVSIHGLHRYRKLRAIFVLSRLAWPFLSADGQPSGNQRIQQE